MRRYLSIAVFFLLCLRAGGQAVHPAVDSTLAARMDSLHCENVIAVDSTLVGENIFNLMPSREKGDAGTVTVNQSPALRVAMQKHVASASFRELQGYRIRIFFSNDQNARDASAYAALQFAERFPGHNVYRSFVNPNFKVTVGDFRTRSEALAMLNILKNDFPGAFIVREQIRYNY